MKSLYIVLTLVLGASATELLIVSGEPGTSDYAIALREAAEDWQAAASNAVDTTVIGQTPPTNITDLARLQNHLLLATNRSDTLWIVLHGHGTYDGRNGRFNLRGPDIADTELADLLTPLDRPTVVVCAFASASVPFLTKLSASNRVVVSATRSPTEDSYSYFGRFLAKAIGDHAADLDQDEAISILEAFLHASKQTAEHYLAEQRILTEHALIDDNGDGKGSPLELYRGVRPTRPQADGLRAHQYHLVPSAADAHLTDAQRQRRDTLELELYTLRAKKAELGEAYWSAIKPLLLQIGELYEPPAPSTKTP